MTGQATLLMRSDTWRLALKTISCMMADHHKQLQTHHTTRFLRGSEYGKTHNHCTRRSASAPYGAGKAYLCRRRRETQEETF